MTLESMLKPVKWVDEQILRGYSRFAQKYEKKGIDKYLIATGLNLVAKIGLITSCGISCMNKEDLVYGISLVCSLENTHEAAIYNISSMNAENLETNSKVKDQYVEKMKPIFSAIRLPVLATGTSQIGLGLTNIYNYFLGGDMSALHTASQQIFFGAGLLSWSSAMYVRDSDPKLLEKQPFWKTAVDWAKEKISSLAPQPLPEPVRLYKTLENYVLRSN